MTSHDRAQMIVKNVHAWRFLQYFDEMVEARDERATWIMDAFLFPKKLSVDRHGGALPLAQLTTTMGILLVTFFVGREIDARRWQGRMRTPSDYDVHCGGPMCPASPTIHQMICNMRNTLAHAFDDHGGTSVSYPDDGVISFKTSKGVVSSVTFRTDMGFVTFIRDYVQAIQHLVVEDMHRELRASGSKREPGRRAAATEGNAGTARQRA